VSSERVVGGAPRFAGKTVLLLGGGLDADGSHSNGSAAAVSYAREGARVVVVDRVEAAAEEAVALIHVDGGQASALIGDVTDEDDVRHVVEATTAAHGRIDVLHNNVGATLMGLPPALSLDAWNSALSVNLNSVFLSCKYVLPVMVSQGAGAVVNISSLAASRDTGYPYPAYSASKAAVNQLTATLALHYARDGIRVNAVAPGLIETPLMYRQISSQYATEQEMRDARNEMSPTGHMGTPWDVAEAALFLASDAAHFINGVILPVDGGQHMRSH
jgi:NAD(P)-dependent dehydrogenase (short-subunit alcohol dehydrogenase family)